MSIDFGQMPKNIAGNQKKLSISAFTHRQSKSDFFLYNLNKDPTERDNIAEDFPQILSLMKDMLSDIENTQIELPSVKLKCKKFKNLKILEPFC